MYSELEGLDEREMVDFKSCTSLLMQGNLKVEIMLLAPNNSKSSVHEFPNLPTSQTAQTK